MNTTHGYRAVCQLDGKVVSEKSCPDCAACTCECVLVVCEAAKRAAKLASLDGLVVEFYVETFAGVRLTTRTSLKDPRAPLGRNLPPLSMSKGRRRHAAQAA